MKAVRQPDSESCLLASPYKPLPTIGGEKEAFIPLYVDKRPLIKGILYDLSTSLYKLSLENYQFFIPNIVSKQTIKL